MATPAGALARQILDGEGSIVVGDLGLIALKSMLENGVGYIVCGWGERPTPIDAAIADAQSTVLQRHGIRLRRMRRLDAVESVVTNGGIGTIPGQPHPRGVVIWQGRRGMRPTLERFARLAVPAAVVGICFDADIAHADGIIVVDPEPSAAGFVQAMDHAFALSASAGTPAVVLVREVLLGARGSIHARDNVRAEVMAHADQAAAHEETVAAAAYFIGATTISRPVRAVSETGEAPSRCVVADATHSTVVHRALEEAHRACAAARVKLPAVTVVSTSLPTAALPDQAASLIARAEHVGVLCQKGTPLVRQVAQIAGTKSQQLTHDPVGRIRGDSVALQLLEWIIETSSDERVVAILEQHAETVRPVRAQIQLPREFPAARRIPAQISAALGIAQVAIGVPVRVSDAFPTWKGRTGVALTVVDAVQFGVEGVMTAAPGTQGHVFLVHGPVTDAVHTQAAVAGAQVRMVNSADPREVARAVEHACVYPAGVPTVICATPMGAIVPSTGTMDLDGELAAEDQASLSVLPQECVAIVEQHTDPLAGVVAAVGDTDAIAGARPALQRITPALYSITRHARPGFFGQLRRRIHRRTLQMGGVDA